MTIESVVPDTVTSWMVDGFALSPTLGLGIMKQPRVFTVNQPFYIIADLPYSIKRDEVVVIQVTVFNFLGTTLTSDVTLFNKNDEIEFVDNYVEFESATDVTLSDMNVRAVETHGKMLVLSCLTIDLKKSHFSYSSHQASYRAGK